MTRNDNGLSRADVVALIVMAAVLAAVLFPVFATTRPRPPEGLVRGAAGRPVPGARLRFRDANGRVVADVSADENGRFERRNLRALSQNAVDGFALTRYLHSTGGPGAYVFSPLGTHEIVFRDGSGRPAPGVAVSLRPEPRTWQTPATPETLDRISDANGAVMLPNTPLSAGWEVYSRDRRYAVQNVEAPHVNQNGFVRSSVLLVAPAAITGRLISGKGAPLGGYKVIVARAPDVAASRHERRYFLGGSGRNGRFRVTSLLPGTYFVSVAEWRSSRSFAPARRVVLTSGQTANVNDLRLESATK